MTIRERLERLLEDHGDQPAPAARRSPQRQADTPGWRATPRPETPGIVTYGPVNETLRCVEMPDSGAPGGKVMVPRRGDW